MPLDENYKWTSTIQQVESRAISTRQPRACLSLACRIPTALAGENTNHASTIPPSGQQQCNHKITDSSPNRIMFHPIFVFPSLSVSMKKKKKSVRFYRSLSLSCFPWQHRVAATLPPQTHSKPGSVAFAPKSDHQKLGEKQFSFLFLRCKGPQTNRSTNPGNNGREGKSSNKIIQ
ncbi:unnamed protein product [Ectocarpus sp. 6 AP-2014]